MKISFKKLCKLVANIDYIFADSFPVSFSVINNGIEKRFECGIGECDEEVMKNDYDFSTSEFEYQCLIDYDKDMIIDIQDPDWMEWNDICDMLKEKCGITKKSEIILDEGISFDGTKLTITDELLAPELKVLRVDDEDDDFEI